LFNATGPRTDARTSTENGVTPSGLSLKPISLRKPAYRLLEVDWLASFMTTDFPVVRPEYPYTRGDSIPFVACVAMRSASQRVAHCSVVLYHTLPQGP